MYQHSSRRGAIYTITSYTNTLNKQQLIGDIINNSVHDTLFSNESIQKRELYIQRIKYILGKYDEFIKERENNKGDKEKDIYERITSLYPQQDINHFIADYNDFVNNIDKNDYYEDNACLISKCNYIGRGYRDLNKLVNTDTRSKLYHAQNTEENVAISQMLDSAHIILYHIYDMGYRLRADDDIKNENNEEEEAEQEQEQKQESKQNNDEEENDEKNTADFNERLDRIKKIINTRKQEFESLRPDLKDDTNKNIDEHKRKFNKFVIDVHGKFDFGKRYFYHARYKNMAKESETIPGSRMQETGNAGERFRTWYIEKKYSSLEEELLNNKIHPLKLWQWKNCITKAKLKWTSLKDTDVIKKAIFIFAKVYDIESKSVVTLQHIIALLLYTNFSELCFKFSQTYRRLNDNETDSELKARHQEYAIWGRLLRELVESFGTYLQYSKVENFYTGISAPLLFNGFCVQICCPLSTAATQAPALNFAERGILITIKNTKSATSYINCVPWSDYPHENERLFVGGFNPLTISGIQHIPTSTDFSNYIKAMEKFERCIQGQPIFNGVKLYSKQSNCGRKLAKQRLKKYDKKLPKYMTELFEAMCLQQRYVALDPCLLNGEMVYDLDTVWKYEGSGICHGYKKWKNIFVDENEMFRVRDICKLFPNSIAFYCQNQYPVEENINVYRLKPSMEITGKLLDEFLNVLVLPECKWQWIRIYYPTNEENQINELIKKYSPRFSDKSFRLELKAETDPSFDKKYDCLCITG